MQNIFKERPGLGMVLKVIQDKLTEKESRIQAFREGLLKEIKGYERQIELLKEFEERHLDELNSIFTLFADKPRHYCLPFLTTPINDLNCWIDFTWEILANPNHSHLGPRALPQSIEGYSFPITLMDFEELTGINHKNATALILELERRGMIARKRVCGGYVYAIREHNV